MLNRFFKKTPTINQTSSTLLTDIISHQLELLPEILKHNYAETIFVNRQFSTITREANIKKAELQFTTYLEKKELDPHTNEDAIDALKTIMIYLNLCMSIDASCANKQRQIAVLIMQIIEVMAYLTSSKTIPFTLAAGTKMKRVDSHFSLDNEYEPTEIRNPVTKDDIGQLETDVHVLTQLTQANSEHKQEKKNDIGELFYDGLREKIEALIESVSYTKEAPCASYAHAAYSCFFSNKKVKKEIESLYKLISLCLKSMKEKTELYYDHDIDARKPFVYRFIF